MNVQGELDVVVIGAGMAGLGCALRLAEAGLRVCVIEAGDVVGGRVRSAVAGGQVVELGAEFVHGRPPELLELIAEARLALCEREGTQVRFEEGRLEPEAEDQDDSRLQPIEQLRTYTGEDMSFRDYLEGLADLRPRARAEAEGYVEGFNAADAGEISAVSLGVQQAGEDSIEGDRVAHVREGYDRLPEFLAERLRAAGGEIRCGVPVNAIHWGPGRVALETSAGEVVAPKAVITVPLGVLQAGSVRIVPEPAAVLAAAATMRMGQVCRFSMVFAEEFWREIEPQPAMRELSFLFDLGELPSVWWTKHPEGGAVLTAWVGGPRAEPLLHRSEGELAELGIRQLARMFSVPEQRVREQLLACRSCDWSADPCFRGAYSYVAVGGADASARMSTPLERTLYFAGEHTDTTGHWGTVHGALRSGYRAARQVLAG